MPFPDRVGTMCVGLARPGRDAADVDAQATSDGVLGTPSLENALIERNVDVLVIGRCAVSLDTPLMAECVHGKTEQITGLGALELPAQDGRRASVVARRGPRYPGARVEAGARASRRVARQVPRGRGPSELKYSDGDARDEPFRRGASRGPRLRGCFKTSRTTSPARSICER